MPFLTDASWPAGLKAIFDVCRQRHEEREWRYYGPYMKLLAYCFGPSDSFRFIISTYPPPDESSSSIQPLNPHEGFNKFLVVFDAHLSPVLMVEINHDIWDKSPCHRYGADDQMRQGYYSMLADCPIPRLWGLSFIGTSLRIYVGDAVTGEITPHYISDQPNLGALLPYKYLEGTWDIDILSQAGFNKMKEIVGDIMANAGAGREA